jgi:hypothetical protein
MQQIEVEKVGAEASISRRFVGFHFGDQEYTVTLASGALVEARMHYDRSLAIYTPGRHGAQAMRFGTDAEVSALLYRSFTLFYLGYPEAALADAERALSRAREIDAASLMQALCYSSKAGCLCHSIIGSRGSGDLAGLAASHRTAPRRPRKLAGAGQEAVLSNPMLSVRLGALLLVGYLGEHR